MSLLTTQPDNPAAASAWDSLAIELHATAASYSSMISGATTGSSAEAMAAAAGPYVIPEGAGSVNPVVDQGFCWLSASVWAASGKDRGQDAAPAA